MTIRIFVLALGFLSAATFGQPQGSAARPVKTLKVLTTEEIDPSRLLPPPPADGSENQRKELAEVRRLVKSRTPERFAQAKWDNEHEDPSAFAATIGPDFDLSKLPETSKLLAVIMNDQAVASGRAKEFFHRKVPVSAEVPEDYQQWSCDTNARKPSERPLRSYPSAHSTMAYSVGIVLAALMPEKSQAILARAADYAYSREICGDHYHADVEASHALGTALGIMFLRSEALKPQIEAAKAELRTKHLTME